MPGLALGEVPLCSAGPHLYQLHRRHPVWLGKMEDTQPFVPPIPPPRFD